MIKRWVWVSTARLGPRSLFVGIHANRYNERRRIGLSHLGDDHGRSWVFRNRTRRYRRVGERLPHVRGVGRHPHADGHGSDDLDASRYRLDVNPSHRRFAEYVVGPAAAIAYGETVR